MSCDRHSEYGNDLRECSHASPPLSITSWAVLWMNLALQGRQEISLHYGTFLPRGDPLLYPCRPLRDL